MLDIRGRSQMGHDGKFPHWNNRVDRKWNIYSSLYTNIASSVLLLQDVLENEDITLDWMFKMSFATDLARVSAVFSASYS